MLFGVSTVWGAKVSTAISHSLGMRTYEEDRLETRVKERFVESERRGGGRRGGEEIVEKFEVRSLR